MKITPLALCAALLAAPAAAQLSFDYITFDRLSLDAGPGRGSWHPHQGILVNTGTVPIDLAIDWREGALLFGRLIGPLDPSEAQLGITGAPTIVLQPGQAFGSSDPLYVRLLQPGEVLIPGSALLAFRLPLGPAQSTATLQTCVQIGDQALVLSQDIAIGDGSTGEVAYLSARRFKSSPTETRFELWGESCPLPSGPLTLSAVGGGETGGTDVIAAGSNMPVVGNSAFGLRLDGATAAQVGAPWLLVTSTAQAHVNVLGCWVYLDTGTSVVNLVGGAIQLDAPSGSGRALAPTVGFPIPADPAVLGTELWAQAIVLTDTADNGGFVLSDGVHIAVGECQ